MAAPSAMPRNTKAKMEYRSYEEYLEIAYEEQTDLWAKRLNNDDT